ncbi:MAG TPA: hypothetical protein VNQ74_16005 [Burkholderiaceae bacterium]|nr:hypothetical protein [Burkholderiaceae bacterium]
MPVSYDVGAAASQAGESSSPHVLTVKEPLAHDDDYLLVSRRVLYLQAILITLVAAIAFGAGYLIGAATNRDDASARDTWLDRNQRTDD